MEVSSSAHEMVATSETVIVSEMAIKMTSSAHVMRLDLISDLSDFCEVVISIIAQFLLLLEFTDPIWDAVSHAAVTL